MPSSFHREASQPNVQEIRERFHPAIGELARENGVAGIGQGREHNRHRVLGAARHDHTLGGAVEPGALEKPRARFALTARAVMRLIVERRPRVALRYDPRHALGERFAFRVRKQAVGRQVDGRGFRLRSPQMKRFLLADESSATDLAAHETAPFGFGIGAGDRRQRHVELVSKLPLWREPHTFREPPAGDVLRERVRNR